MKSEVFDWEPLLCRSSIHPHSFVDALISLIFEFVDVGTMNLLDQIWLAALEARLHYLDLCGLCECYTVIEAAQ